MTQEKNIFLPFLKSDESAEFSSSLMNLLKIFNLIKVQEISKMLTSRVVVLQFVHQRAATSHIFNWTRFSTFLVFSSTNFHFMCSYMKHRQPDNISLNSENQPLSLIYYCSQSAYFYYWLTSISVISSIIGAHLVFARAQLQHQAGQSSCRTPTDLVTLQIAASSSSRSDDEERPTCWTGLCKRRPLISNLSAPPCL